MCVLLGRRSSRQWRICWRDWYVVTMPSVSPRTGWLLDARALPDWSLSSKVVDFHSRRKIWQLAAGHIVRWMFCFSITIYYHFTSAAVAVDSSRMTASSSALWSTFSPHSNFVNGHVSTMWFMVCRWPQSQEGDWSRLHLCKLARHGPDLLQLLLVTVSYQSC